MNNKGPQGTPSPAVANPTLSDLFYEKETEYFGTTPYAFLDRIGQLIVDSYFSALGQLRHTWLPNAAPFLSEKQIAAALTQWTLLVEAAIDKNFEIFETYVMKNVLALPAGFVEAAEKGEDGLEERFEHTLGELRDAVKLNRSLRVDSLRLAKFNEASSNISGHIQNIQLQLQQHRLQDSLLGRQMTVLGAELNALKLIVKETLEAGSNYLFAKYDSDSNSVAGASNAALAPSASDSYRRILEEMAGLQATIVSAEHKEAKRRETLHELAAANKIATSLELDNFRRLLKGSVPIHA